MMELKEKKEEMIKFGKNQVGQLCGAAPAEGNTPPAEGAEGNTHKRKYTSRRRK